MIDILNQPPSIRLSLEHCETLYSVFLSKTKDLFYLPPFETRYKGKLEGILGSVAQTFDGVYLFPTIGSSAAAYFVKISTQHPFRDGNKRMAVAFSDIFLQLNGFTLNISWEKMYVLAMMIVDHKTEGESADRLQAFVEHILSENK